MKFEEYVYESLQGTLVNPHPEVKNLFKEGMPCDQWYSDMLDAYQRLCVRLGVSNEDDDVEIIVNSLLNIQREMAFHMYYYGAKFKEHVLIVHDDN